MAPFLETLALVRCSGRRRVGIFVSHKFRQSGWRSVAPACLSSPTLRQKALWRNRRPFVFAIRGHRKVKFRGGGRDGIVLEEDGHRVNIFSELLGGKTSRGIHANSIKKYEPPHEGEPSRSSARRKS